MFEKLKGKIAFIKGKKPELFEYIFENSLVYLTAEYLRTGNAEYYVDKHSLNEKFHCNEEDLLIIWDGSNSGEVFLGKPGVLSSTMAKIKLIDNDYLERYLYYFLKYNFNILNSNVTGAAIPHLNRNTLENLLIYKAKIEEQQEIVQVLDTINDVIRLRKECIQHAQDLIPALFQEMFAPYINNNADYVPIGTITSDTKQIDPSKIFETEFYYIDIASINNNTGIIETPKIISINNIPSRARKIVQTNDILISMTRPYLKGFSIVPEYLNGQIASTGFSVLRTIPEKLSPLYLNAYTKTNMFIKQLIPKMKGANYPAVRDSDVKNVRIPLPPIELQEQFAQKVIEIENYIKEQNEELENAEQMFQSLLHHAFTGELTRRAYGKD